MLKNYLRPVNPKCNCEDCVYLSNMVEVHTGKKYCYNLDIYVNVIGLCPDFHRKD